MLLLRKNQIVQHLMTAMIAKKSKPILESYLEKKFVQQLGWHRPCCSSNLTQMKLLEDFVRN